MGLLHLKTLSTLPKTVWTVAFLASAALFAGGVSCAVGSGDTVGDGGLGDDGGIPVTDATGDAHGDVTMPGHPHHDAGSDGRGGTSGDTGHKDGSGGHQDGAGEGGTGEGGGGGAVPIGLSCAGGKTCAPPGICTTLGTAGQYCTEPCPVDGGTCPTNTYCSIIGGADLCVPYLSQECITCTQASNCKIPSDNCLTTPMGEQFCARDCTVDGVCPMGYVCANGASYSADASVGPVNAGDAGGVLADWCVPTGGANCSCSPATNGATETCVITNSYGTCSKPATCNGATGVWEGCQTPAAEICNGIDDNCNGQVDEGNPDTLCAFQGSPPPNANWACTNGMCTLGACDPGWANFLDAGTITSGCSCTVNPAEPNSTCAQASNSGSVQSTGGGSLLITSTLSTTTDVNVWTFSTVDVAQSGTNSYNVNIAFTEPAVNNEFVMDVERGAPCTNTPTGSATDVTSYSWCVNAADTPDAGQLTCGPTATHHCDDDSVSYWVRVHRKAGATPTCTPYQLTITGGGGTCTLGSTCN